MMNRNKLLRLASEWSRTAKNDLRNKVRNFMEEMGTNEEELSYALGISEGELEQILHGNCNVSIDTFAKILIAAGLAIEILPIEATPFGGYDHMPPPPPNFHPRMPRHMPPPQPVYEDDDDEGYDDDDFEDPTPPRRPSYEAPHPRRYVDPRQNSSRRPQPAPEPEYNWHDVDGDEDDEEPIVETPQTTPKFRAMPIGRLKEIIEERLWDSEIDLNSASKEELIRFLDNKDRAFKRVRERRGQRRDSEVNAYREGLRESVERRRGLNSRR